MIGLVEAFEDLVVGSAASDGGRLLAVDGHRCAVLEFIELL